MLAGSANSLNARRSEFLRLARDYEQILVDNLDGTSGPATVPSRDGIREGAVERCEPLRCAGQVCPNGNNRPEVVHEEPSYSSGLGARST
jgi:hypothetical protein